MGIFKQMKCDGHEELVFAQDKLTGLRTIIAVHSTRLGPALGGTRMWDYASEEDALYDVLRLSHGMTLKNAAAGLKRGGGKAVILGDPKKLKSREFFYAYARIINSLGGRYYTAEDVNISAQDVGYMRDMTPFVVGTPALSGNPSPFTARGVYRGAKAGAKLLNGSDGLKGMVFAVQGLGNVGYGLCELLRAEGAELKVYDLNQGAVERAVAELGAQAVSAEDILTTPCDVFAPCALGAVLNRENVKRLSCKMVCGAANNVLVDEATGEALEELGILYLPDYIVNAGGVINCEAEDHYDAAEVTAKVDRIYDTTLNIVALAREKGITTYAAADLYAMNIIYPK